MLLSSLTGSQTDGGMPAFLGGSLNPIVSLAAGQKLDAAMPTGVALKAAPQSAANALGVSPPSLLPVPPGGPDDPWTGNTPAYLYDDKDMLSPGWLGGDPNTGVNGDVGAYDNLATTLPVGTNAAIADLNSLHASTFWSAPVLAEAQSGNLAEIHDALATTAAAAHWYDTDLTSTPDGSYAQDQQAAETQLADNFSGFSWTDAACVVSIVGTTALAATAVATAPVSGPLLTVSSGTPIAVAAALTVTTCGQAISDANSQAATDGLQDVFEGAGADASNGAWQTQSGNAVGPPSVLQPCRCSFRRSRCLTSLSRT